MRFGALRIDIDKIDRSIDPSKQEESGCWTMTSSQRRQIRCCWLSLVSSSFLLLWTLDVPSIQQQHAGTVIAWSPTTQTIGTLASQRASQGDPIATMTRLMATSSSDIKAQMMEEITAKRPSSTATTEKTVIRKQKKMKPKATKASTEEEQQPQQQRRRRGRRPKQSKEGEASISAGKVKAKAKASKRAPKTLGQISVEVKKLAREIAAKRKREAAEAAAAIAAEQQERGGLVGPFGRNPPPLYAPGEPLKDLRDLSRAIDRQLQQPPSIVPTQYGNNRVRNSVESLLEHNYGRQKQSRKLTKPPLSSERNVAVVFGKVLVDDQITLEYAARLRTLARLIADGELKPSMLCFCGGVSRGNYLSSGDAGYMFFKQLCLSERIPLDGMKIFVDRTSLNEGKSLQNVANHIKKECLAEWLAVSKETESLTDEYGFARSAPRKKIRVHFTLVSTDYHLCNLNDIHLRSPDQSLLRPILYLSNEKTMRRYQKREDAGFSRFTPPAVRRQIQKEVADQNGIVSTSWSFSYATYPFLYATDDTTAFMGQCYLLGEKLVPLMYNLRAILNDVSDGMADLDGVPICHCIVVAFVRA